MRRAHQFTQRELQAGMKAAKAAGMRAVFELMPNGHKRVWTEPLTAHAEPTSSEITAAIRQATW